MKASGVSKSNFPVFFCFFFTSLPILAKVQGNRGKRVALTVVTGWFGLAVVILFKSADMCRYLDI